jgi:hypothetical protein
MEEMLETVVYPPRRVADSDSNSEIESDAYSDEDEDEYRSLSRSQRDGESEYNASLQVVDLQTIETDNASSPYSFAFRIDAFSRKVSATDGEFQNLGHGRYLRQDIPRDIPLNQSGIDARLAETLLTLYFEELWLLFPIVDKEAFWHQFRGNESQPGIVLQTAIQFAASSVASQQSHSAAISEVSSPSLTPQSLSAITSELVGLLRSLLAQNLAAISKPILEPRITTLQAILLRCLYDVRLTSEQRSLLISDAIRIGQYILLHRSLSNIPPSDKLLRKHLWWTIFVLEVWTCARDLSSPSLILNEIDSPMPIESEEPDHGTYTALVALTRILHDALRRVFAPTVDPRDIPRDVERLRNWVMDWYRNLPNELLVSEDSSNDDAANFLLAGCHAVLLLLYNPLKHENLVKSEVERSSGIIREAIGRLGRKIGIYGVIATVIGDIVRKYGR